MQDIFQPRANSKLRPVTNSNTSRSPSVGGSEASGHPQKLVALRRCQGRRAPRPSAQATGGTAPSPEPRGPRSARSPACAGRPFPEAAARPRHPRPARPPPATPPARAPPAPRPEVASPHGGQSGEGARSPPAARAHGRSAAARPRRPAAAARFWGRALLGGGGLPGARAGRQGSGAGEGKGAREGGGRGEKKGAQTRRGRKGGRGRSRRGRKARSPPPAAACALRHHVRRGRQRVLRCSRPCFLCAPLRAGARSRHGCPLRGARRALRA